MELAKTFQATHLVPRLKFLEADDAFLGLAI